MTKKEIVNRNIGLTFDFVREIIKHPTLARQLPVGGDIEFVEKDPPEADEKALGNKFIVKVKSVFEPVNKVAEPKAIYKRKSKD